MAIFIPKKPEEKEIISLRIPSDTLKKVDLQASLSSISRNELINQMILFSLEHMVESPATEEVVNG